MILLQCGGHSRQNSPNYQNMLVAAELPDEVISSK